MPALSAEDTLEFSAPPIGRASADDRVHRAHRAGARRRTARSTSARSPTSCGRCAIAAVPARRRGQRARRADGGGGRLARHCSFCYELRLHRARGYGALKAILEILAEEEGLTLTEISQRLQRTPGSTKDYLSWLEDVDLVDVAPEALQLSPTRCSASGSACTAARHAPSDDDLAREMHRYAMPRLPQPQPEPARALAACRSRHPAMTTARAGASSRSTEQSAPKSRLQPSLEREPRASCSASFLLGPVPSASASPARRPPPPGTASDGRGPIVPVSRYSGSGLLLTTAGTPAAPTCSPAPTTPCAFDLGDERSRTRAR